jgi:hypothetical protein
LKLRISRYLFESGQSYELIYIFVSMDKMCTKCSENKDIVEFDVKTNGSISGYCKECRRACMRSHYTNNKLYYISKSSKQKKRNSQKYKQLKSNLCCEDCKISFRDKEYLCDFHHINPKDKDFELGNFNEKRWSAVIEEIKKCIPLCANCHRIRHNCPVV